MLVHYPFEIIRVRCKDTIINAHAAVIVVRTSILVPVRIMGSFTKRNAVCVSIFANLVQSLEFSVHPVSQFRCELILVFLILKHFLVQSHELLHCAASAETLQRNALGYHIGDNVIQSCVYGAVESVSVIALVRFAHVGVIVLQLCICVAA